MTFDAIDQMAVSTIRSLSIEAIQAANSGHPGLPMGAAPNGLCALEPCDECQSKD